MLELAAAGILETPGGGQSADIVLAGGAGLRRRSFQSPKLDIFRSFWSDLAFPKKSRFVNSFSNNNFNAANPLPVILNGFERSQVARTERHVGKPVNDPEPATATT
jgi:hypothetical protein